jgi:selenocysteine lyase/cysteine desulfurase
LVMQLRKSRFFLFARGSQLDNVVTSPWEYSANSSPWIS